MEAETPTPRSPSGQPTGDADRGRPEPIAAQFARLWADTPEWYRVAAVAIATLFVIMVGLFALLTLAGITQTATTAWGALFVAGTTLATFFVGRLAQELERRDQRQEARIDLAVALYAEIASNLEWQRQIVTKELIARKLEAEFAAEDPIPPRSPAAPTAASEKPGSSADDSDPIFARAVENYDRIPQPCMFAVVRYYNLNGMLNTATGFVSLRAMSGMTPQHKKRTLIAYYRLAYDADAAGETALDLLRAFIDKPEIVTDADKALRGMSLGAFDEQGLTRQIDALIAARAAQPTSTGTPAANVSELSRSEGLDLS